MRALLVSIACLIPMPAFAAIEQMGVYGNVWEIQEKDAIAAIKSKIQQMEKSGEIDRIQKSWQARAMQRIEDGPDPVPGIKRATSPSVRLFDPTVVAPEDILDHQGRVVVPAGTRVNPLQYGSLSRRYILLDGRDDRQVMWAAKQSEDYSTRLILVAGSPFKLDRKYGAHDSVRFFFDQGGRIVKRFGIAEVPAIITQKGERVEIRTITLD